VTASDPSTDPTAPRRTRDAERTTRALLAAARAEFARVGYREARTEAIVAAAGATRGALYHHFRDKLDLFTAVLEEIQAEITAEVRQAAATAGPSPIDAMRRGFERYLDCCTRDDVRRIVLVDGPSVVGWETWHDIDERHAIDATRAAVRRAIDAGELPRVAVDPLARVLLGMITQAGLEIGRSANPRRRRRDLGGAVDTVLAGLRTA
jgi:AcrR family transcriptional regulator